MYTHFSYKSFNNCIQHITYGVCNNGFYNPEIHSILYTHLVYSILHILFNTVMVFVYFNLLCMALFFYILFDNFCIFSITIIIILYTPCIFTQFNV